MARAEIMRSAVSFGFKGFLAIPDNHSGTITAREFARLQNAIP